MKELIKKIKNKYFIYVTTHTVIELENIKEKYKNEKNIKCFKLDVTSKVDKQKIKDLDIDIFVANSAIGIGGSIINMNMNNIRNNFEVNVFSNFELIQIILKNMLEKK